MVEVVGLAVHQLSFFSREVTIVVVIDRQVCISFKKRPDENVAQTSSTSVPRRLSSSDLLALVRTVVNCCELATPNWLTRLPSYLLV